MPKGPKKAIARFALRQGKARRPVSLAQAPQAKAGQEADLGAQAKPERLTKAQAEAERYPGLDKHPALQRALVLHRAMEAGKSRDEAEALADKKVGPRAPRFNQSKPMKRGKRPTAPQRQRVKPVADRRPRRR